MVSKGTFQLSDYVQISMRYLLNPMQDGLQILVSHYFDKNVASLGLLFCIEITRKIRRALRLVSTELTDDNNVISSADGHFLHPAAGQKFVSCKYCPELCDS